MPCAPNSSASPASRTLKLDASYRYNKLVDHFHSPAVKLDPLTAPWTQTVLRLFSNRRASRGALWHFSGELRQAQIFVAALGASNYSYIEARWTQGLADWIGSHLSMLAFFEDVTRQIVCDNLKAGVTAACRYEPGINRTYQKMAAHYGTVIVALDFLTEAANVVLVGPNGVGKSTLAQNIAHQALIAGHTALFTSAGQLLGDLCALDSDSALRRRLRHYARPELLVIDEVGYLSYSNRHADLMFELVSRRYQSRSTLITTNRPFAEWHEVFPTAACVVSLIDRLVHNAEIIAIEGDSYRLKEARERTDQRARQRRAGKS